MTYLIFAAVAAALYGMAHVLGITYNTANIVVYYLAIPLSWALMLDRIGYRQQNTLKRNKNDRKNCDKGFFLLTLQHPYPYRLEERQHYELKQYYL